MSSSENMHAALSRFLEDSGPGAWDIESHDAGAPPTTKSTPVSPPGVVLQTLTEPAAWTWPVPSLGTTPHEAYSFLDTMPVSAEGTVYVPGSTSFSSLYATFLQLLDSSGFPNLDAAIRINTPPAFDPNAATPSGWTRVNQLTSVMTVRPAWEIPQYPFDWINSVNRLQMQLNLGPGEATLHAADAGTATAAQSVSRLGFSAEAWGAIPVTPGLWFDSSFIALARLRDGPWKGSGITAAKMFGPQMLESRVAQFIVALNPRVEFEVPAPSGTAALSAVGAAGFHFNAGAPLPGAVTASITATPLQNNAVHIAAQASGQDQAFIIAVQLEKMNP